MAVKFSNNFSTALASSISSSDTVIELLSVSGLPTLGAGDYTYLTFDTDTNSPTIEIVKVTAINAGTNEVTVTRAQDGTTASSFAAGTKVELRLSAILLNDVSDEASVTDWGDILNKPSLLLTNGDGSDLTDVRAETVEVNVKNVSGGSLAKGTPVHQTGTSGAATFEVVAADASNASVMPAHFVLLETLADQAEGRGLLMGRVSGVDTSSFSEGDTIYVAVGGGYTNVAPAGEGNLIQNLGTVTKVHASNGGGEVMGAGRSNATPNLNNGNIFIGNASNQATTASLSTSVSNLSHYNNANWDTAYSWGNHASQGYATTTYVDTAVSNLVDAAPTTLDTLNELAAALGDDPNFATTVSNQIGLKQDASTALTTSTTFGGDVSGTYNAIVIADDSHTHDGRYYTESEADSRFVNAAGDTMTGELTFYTDNEGITFHGGGRFYKQLGQGLVIRKPNGGQELRFEDNSGNYLGTFWHSGNDGASSGLDADLLDGQHGSYYYSAGNPPPYPSDADTVDGLHAASFLRSDANDTATGVITFSNVSDYQIHLDGAGGAWAGIRWSDVNGSDYIWYNGQNSTYAIGGGGANVAGKKLHVNGGLSVGTSVGGTTTPTNGILSQGSVNAPIFYDSDDTSWYVNPNADSRVARLLVGDGSSYIRIGNESEGYNNTYARIRTNSYGHLYLDAKDGGNIYLSWYSGSPSVVMSEAAAQFPIYYDRNNTGFYADPAGTSNFGYIHTTGIGTTGTVTAGAFQASGSIGNLTAGSLGQQMEKGDASVTTLRFDADRWRLYAGNNAGEIISAYENGNIDFTTGSLLKGGTVFMDASRNITVGSVSSVGNSQFNGSGSSGAALTVNRGSDGAQALQVYNTGEVVVGSNYFYVSNSAGAYFTGAIRARGGISNDQGDLSLDDNVIVAGTLHVNGATTLSNTSNHYQGHFYYDPFDSNGNHYPHFLDGANGNGVDINWRLYTGASNSHTHVWSTSQAYFSTILASGIDVRGPRFYDWNDTTYFADPAAISSFYGLAIRGDQSISDSENQIFLYGAGDTTTSAIGFKYGGEFPNPTSQGDGYNTYFSMDTSGRGWVFRRVPGSSDFSAAFTAGWILNNGIAQFNSSTRSPIFYDSNDTSYLVDPSSTSRVYDVRANYLTRPGHAEGHLVGSYNNVGANSQYTNPIYTIGSSYNPTNSDLVDMYGIGYTHSNANYGGISSVLDGWGMYVAAGGQARIGLSAQNGNGLATGSWRAPIFYDSNDTSYYTDPNGTSRINTLVTTGGNSYFNNNRIVLRADGIEDHQTAGDGGNIQVNYYGYGNGHSYFRNFDVYNGKGNFQLQVHGSGNYTRIWGSLQTTSITDTDDSSFYLNPNGTSRLNLISPYVRFSPGSVHGNSLEANEVHLMDAGSASVLADGLQFNAAAFTVPVMYARSGSTWTNIGNQPQLCDGRAAHDWGRVTLSRSYDEFVFYFGTQFGYTIFSAVTILHSTSGNSMTIYVESSETGGATDSGWTQIATSGDTGSWPGSTTLTCQTGVGAGYNDQFRIRIVPNWSHASNTISIGQIIVRAGYGTFRRLFDWDYNKNVNFQNNATSTTSFRAPIFYDSNDTAFYVDPASTSRIRRTNLVASGSGWDDGLNLYSADQSNRWNLLVDNGAGDIFRLAFNNSEAFGVGTDREAYFTAGLRANIYYDRNDTGYYVDPNVASFLSGPVTINGNDNQLRINGTYGPKAAGIFFQQDGVNKYELYYYSGQFRFWNYARAAQEMNISDSGVVTVHNDFRAPIMYDVNNTSYYVDPASSSQLNTVSLGSGSKLHLVSLADGNHFLRYISTGFSGVTIDGPQLGGHQGGELITNYGGDNWSFRWDSAGNTFSRASSRAPIFYDSNDTSFYLDPTGNSLLRTVYTQNGSYHFRPRYADGTDIYSGSFNWYGLQLGNNGSNYIVAGRTNPSGRLDIYVNNTSDFPSINGTHSSRFDSDGIFYNYYSVRSPIFYDSNDTGYYVDPASGTRLGGFVGIGGSPGSDDGNWGARLNVGGIPHARIDVICQNDGIITTMYSHQQQGVGKIGTMSNHPLALMAQYGNIGGYVYNGSIRAPLFYDSNDTNYYVDPASGSVLQAVTMYGRTRIGGELYVSSINSNTLNSGFTHAGNGSDIWINYRGYNEGQDYTRDFRVGNGRGSQVMMVSGSGSYVEATNDFRAPIFYDSNNTGYYVDPASSSVLSTLTTYGTFSTTGNIFINNSSPTIYLQDTDNRSSMIHCNSNIFYVLRASGTNSTGWATYNGYWPMELSLETNDATFGNAITAVGNITAYSDARKKKDIRPLEGGLEYLSALDAKRYKWRVDDREDIGFIAQDVEAAGLDVFVIESERKDPDTGEHIESVKSLDYGRMVSVLWQAVKEQQTQIEAMAAEIKSLKEMKQ